MKPLTGSTILAPEPISINQYAEFRYSAKLRVFSLKSKFSKFHSYKIIMIKMRVNRNRPIHRFLTLCKLQGKII